MPPETSRSAAAAARRAPTSTVMDSRSSAARARTSRTARRNPGSIPRMIANAAPVES